MLFRRAGVEAYNPFDMAYAHQVSARLAPVLATSGLSVQKIVRYIENMATGAGTRESATLTISRSQAHTMSHEHANSGRTQSLFERLIQNNDPLLGQIDRNAKSLLQSALGKLDVVSREEFDAQTAVLQRTRQRLEVLEQQIETLSDTLEQSAAP